MWLGFGKVTGCDHKPECLTWENCQMLKGSQKARADFEEIMKLKEALRAAPKPFVPNLGFEDAYETWYNGKRAEALGEKAPEVPKVKAVRLCGGCISPVRHDCAIFIRFNEPCECPQDECKLARVGI